MEIHKQVFTGHIVYVKIVSGKKLTLNNNM